MKLICLNVCGGVLYNQLIEYINSTSSDTDIYCFQEIYDTNSNIIQTHSSRANLYLEIKNILPDFNGYDAFVENGYDYEGKVDYDLKYGIVSFVRKNIKLIETGHFTVHGKEFSTSGNFEDHPRAFQWLTIEKDTSMIHICNFHGVWQPNTNKKDTPERIQQSKQILDFLEKHKHPTIIAGDFNLIPDSQSLKMLEEKVINLNRLYNVFDTRSSLYKKEVRSGDYIFTTPSLKISDFYVENNLVSDHLPLVVLFD